jgi:hypothetical protein
VRVRAACFSLAALMAASGCGSGGGGDRADPFTKVEQSEKAKDVRAEKQAAPRWERVTTLRGSGAASRSVLISKKAVQWRIRWRCTRGRFAVSVTPSPREGNPLADARCGGKSAATTIDTGRLRLNVRSPGRWRAVVEEQVTSALDEAPLPAMKARAAKVLSRGLFYPIERRGRGTAILYRLPNDRLALRLEGFSTSANTDLFVWTSRAARPRTTKRALRTPHRQFTPLRSTLGNQNYLLPRGAHAKSIRSIVIWCQPIQIAYTAATLR